MFKRQNNLSKITYDFKIVSTTSTPGVSLVYAMNEDAYNYLVEEAEFTTFVDGSAPIYTHRVGDFISDSAAAHLCSDYR